MSTVEPSPFKVTVPPVTAVKVMSFSAVIAPEEVFTVKPPAASFKVPVTASIVLSVKTPLSLISKVPSTVIFLAFRVPFFTL